MNTHLIFPEGVACTSNDVERVAHLSRCPNDLDTRHEWHLTIDSISIIATYKMIGTERSSTHLSRKQTSNLGVPGLPSKLSLIISNAIFPFSAVVT